MVALVWSMKHIFGIEPGDVFFAASDIGNRFSFFSIFRLLC